MTHTKITPEMIEAAEEAYIPFGDMGLAIQCALAVAQQVGEPFIDHQIRTLATALGLSEYDLEMIQAITDDSLYSPEAVPVPPQGLFEAIEHGDEKHRAWLKAALTAFFAGKPRSPKAQSLTIPKEGVARFVQELARRYKVVYTSNTMDQWAEAVTRLAGDDVHADSTEDLLVALKRAGKISSHEVAALAISHLRERKKSVRSI